jgi:signal transduction histidine kinase
MAGLSIAVIFIVLMLLLIQQLFKPFDRVLSLIKGSIISGADDDNTVLIRPIDYPKKNEFTPIIEALGDIYRQVSAYLKEIEDSKLQIGTLNAQLEEKVLLRTTQLEKKTRESVVALEQLKVTQQQLIENEKHAALGRLVAGVAHEINTPLGISVTAASCIERDLKTTFENMLDGKLKRSQLKGSYQELKEGCQILNDNLVRAAELVASFKQVAVDQSSIEYRHIELGAYINQILLSLKPRVARTTHQIQVNCESDIELYTQPGALAQIITNLIDNAIIHAFEEQTDGLITLCMQQKEGWVEINVTDNGKGMSAIVLNSIFEPFFTTRRNQGGSGLGMHLVYNLVTQKLNGKISCGSVEGEGSSFVIMLPIKMRMSQTK